MDWKQKPKLPTVAEVPVTSTRHEWVEQIMARQKQQGRAPEPSPLLKEWLAKKALKTTQKTELALPGEEIFG